jgi:hypothetical protein
MCNDLVRAIRTIDAKQTDVIHFFFAGECIKQAKPLLRRFSAGSPPVLRTWAPCGGFES